MLEIETRREVSGSIASTATVAYSETTAARAALCLSSSDAQIIFHIHSAAKKIQRAFPLSTHRSLKFVDRGVHPWIQPAKPKSAAALTQVLSAGSISRSV